MDAHSTLAHWPLERWQGRTIRPQCSNTTHMHMNQMKQLYEIFYTGNGNKQLKATKHKSQYNHPKKQNTTKKQRRHEAILNSAHQRDTNKRPPGQTPTSLHILSQNVAGWKKLDKNILQWMVSWRAQIEHDHIDLICLQETRITSNEMAQHIDLLWKRAWGIKSGRQTTHTLLYNRTTPRRSRLSGQPIQPAPF